MQEFDSELIQSVARRLKELRAQKGFSQEQVYHQTGVHVGRVETGRLNISLTTLNRLCKFYDISVSGFFSILPEAAALPKKGRKPAAQKHDTSLAGSSPKTGKAAAAKPAKAGEKKGKS